MGITITTLHSTRPDKLTVVPTFRDLLPKMPEEHWDEFVASVRTDGVREAVVVWDRRPDKQGLVVVDGHNRLAAAIEAGAESIPVRMIDFVSEQQALQWALRANVTRRHLTPQQMSELRGRLYESEKQEPSRPPKKGRQNVTLSTSPTDSGKTAAKVAKETGVDERTVQRDAAYVRDLDKLRPDLREDARAGKLTKTDVAVLARFDPNVQAEVVELAQREKVTIAAAAEIYDSAQQTLAGEIPPEVTPAERARADMESANEPLREFERAIRALAKRVPRTPWLGDGEADLIASELKTAARSVAYRMGHDICPHCAGDSAECKWCKKVGWMPKTDHEIATRQAAFNKQQAG